jgi:hypothetical protein
MECVPLIFRAIALEDIDFRSIDGKSIEKVVEQY